jgi:hypothetical protein
MILIVRVLALIMSPLAVLREKANQHVLALLISMQKACMLVNIFKTRVKSNPYIEVTS